MTTRTEFPPMTPEEIAALAEGQEHLFSYDSRLNVLVGDYDGTWVMARPEPRALGCDFKIHGGHTRVDGTMDWDDYLIWDHASRENVSEVIQQVAHDLVNDPSGFKIDGMVRSTDGNALLGRVVGFETARTVIVDWNGGPKGMRVSTSSVAPWRPGRPL